MADQRYILPAPRPRCQRISADRWFSIVAIVASVAAAGSTGWYAWDTHEMRIDAQEASRKQTDDVKRARDAAEKSASAAEKSAGAAVTLSEAMKASAKAAQQSAEADLASLDLNKRALVLNNVPSMQVMSSRLARALAIGDVPIVTTKLYNAGKGTAYQVIALQWFIVTQDFRPRNKLRFRRSR